MVSAVAGAAAVRAYAPAAAPTTAPADGQAQLARLQHQLSDNVNCASAGTREGKATIAALQEKIASLKHQIQDPPAATAAAAASATSPARAQIGSASGGVIDVYA